MREKKKAKSQNYFGKAHAQIASLCLPAKHTPPVGGAPEEGQEIMCAECGEGVSSLSHYLAHTRTHLPRPLPIIRFFESSAHKRIGNVRSKFMATSARQRARIKRHEGAAHWRTTRFRIRRKHDGNQRRMAEFWTDADEHKRKREGRIESKGEGTRQGVEGIERTGPPLMPLPDTVQALAGYQTKFGEISREVVERLATVAKLSKTRQPDQTRIQLRLTDEEMQTAECLSLTQLVGKARHGRCPAPPLLSPPPAPFRDGAEQALEQAIIPRTPSTRRLA